MAVQTWVFWVIQFEVGVFRFSVSRLVYFSQKLKKKYWSSILYCLSNTFSFNLLSVFTLHCNILSWNLLKWPPYNAPLPDPPERNQDFENEKRSRPITDTSLLDLNISYSLYAYAFTNSRFWFLGFFSTGMGERCIKSSEHWLTSPFAIFFIFNRIAQQQVKNVWVCAAAVYKMEICIAHIGRSKKKTNDNPIC